MKIPKRRTTFDLREMLFKQMEAIRSGESGAADGMASAMIAKAIVQTVQLEMQYARELRAAGDADAEIAPILLSLPDETEDTRPAIATVSALPPIRQIQKEADDYAERILSSD